MSTEQMGIMEQLWDAYREARKRSGKAEEGRPSTPDAMNIYRELTFEFMDTVNGGNIIEQLSRASHAMLGMIALLESHGLDYDLFEAVTKRFIADELLADKRVEGIAEQAPDEDGHWSDND